MAEALANLSLGGHDDEFVNAVEDELQCAICQLPLKEPILTKCGHRFCKQCLSEHFKRLENDGQQLSCPVDRNNLNQNKDIFPDKATERKILSLIIKCPSKGCQWTGELRSKDNHLASCPMTIISCPYVQMGCATKVQRRNIESHLQLATRLHLDLACVKLNSTQEELRDTTRKLEEKFNVCQNEFKEITRKLEEKIEALENRSTKYVEEYTWKISGFSAVLENAKSGQKTLIYSAPFYRYGYKFRLHLLPNGLDSAKNSHCTIGFGIMKGECDALLSWPFHKRISFTLIDQQQDDNDRENIVKTIADDPELQHYRRPETNENPGLGIRDFVPHSKLVERRYIVDDTVFIQIKISPPDILAQD